MAGIGRRIGTPGAIPPGRPKGAHNKITLDLRKLLDEMGCNPIQGLAEIAMNKKHPVQVRSHACAILCKYLHPTIQSVVLSGGETPVQVEDVSARETLLARIAEIERRRGESGTEQHGRSCD